MPPAHPPRSVLYVPGDKPRAIDKARTLGADAIILDLEDAVAPEHKPAARDHIRHALQTPWPVPVLIRVNALSTPWEHDDRELALTAGASGIVLPKVERAHDAHALSLGLPIWAMIETPHGILNASHIAAVPGVTTLIVGANDLARTLRTQPHPDRTPLLHALSSVVLAARAHGKTPLDAVYNDIRDIGGFTRECQQGRALGFSGKTLIHPGQIDAANQAFGVTVAEAAEAQALIDAWDAARAEGKSIATHQGALVEQMHVDEAREVLALYSATNRV
ncbi:HpcH/HpaI aldolase/citrate lyase family protein [Deinococcus xianganensis]|uniref:HpcH/HpaI aldolase/citrate lyase family protein n=1 Tax=Deinococcus xianganensis TaxID=1507289 RepID=A0A6I4YHA9_9DEIO|nr:CoA ester lyase [Deinococcus xianganensis]MXV19386.1 HpcH/HpaI aldolase/citrate lyase family protein [Deinococcus xianganensis]